MEIEQPDSQYYVADWVELEVAHKNCSISKSRLSRELESTGIEPEEHYISSVWLELDKRSKAYHSSPFRVENREIIPNTEWKNKPDYMTCLIFSVFGGTEGLSKSSKLFERISAEAIKEYISCEIRILGYPRNEHKTLKEQIDSFCIDMKENFAEPPLSEKKDDTVDIIAWKPLGDKRSSQIVILAQCAAGRNWKTKLSSLRCERWKQYIHWACPPIKGFTVPRIISEREWHESSVDAGLLFDRVRIYNLLSRKKLEKKFRVELIKWCTKQLKRLDS